MARASEARTEPPTEMPDAMEWAHYYWKERNLPGADANFVMSSIMRAYQMITARMEEQLKPFGLAMNRYVALMTLFLSEPGKLRLSRIGRQMLIHPTTVTLLIDQLEKAGLVQREPHPTDRRATYAVITPAGQALAREASAALADINFGLPPLSAKKAEQLVRLLGEVRTYQPT